MKLYNKFIIALAQRIIPSWLKGYRSVLLGILVFVVGLIQKLVDSSVLDYICSTFTASCPVVSWFVSGGAMMTLGFLIQLLRGDTDSQLPTNKE